MKEFLNKFEALLKADNIEEAKELLSTFGSLATTPEEEAEAKLFITHLYIKLTNAINKAYIGALDDSLEKLKLLDTKEKQIVDKLTLAKTRVSLA